MRRSHILSSLLSIALLCFGGCPLWAQPELVADLTLDGVNLGSVEAGNFQRTEFRGRLYFAADHPNYGVELWSTDGTGEGLRLVADLCPGRCDSTPEALTVWNGRLYFFAHDGAFGRELWSLDRQGEARLVRDICPGECDAFRLGSAQPASVGDSLYLVSERSGFVRSLWRTNSSRAGTVKVADLPAAAYLPSGSDRLVAAQTKLYILLQQPGVDFPQWPIGLWVLDEEGLRHLSPPWTVGIEWPHLARAVGDDLFFAATLPRSADGFELWRTDGRQFGAQSVDPVCFGVCSALGPESFSQVVGGRYVVSARSPDEVSPLRLYEVVDGEMRRVTAAPTGVQGEIAALGDDVLFFARRSGILELWSYPVGDSARMLASLGARSADATVSIVAARDRAYFLVDGVELWTTDGTAAGTVSLGQPPAPGDLTRFDAGVVFTASDSVRGRELWSAELDEPQLLHDVYPANASSNPRHLGVLDATVLVDFEQPAGVWRVAGTSASQLSSTPSDVQTFYPYNDLLFYTSNRQEDAGLWSSNGTEVEKIFEGIYEGQAFLGFDRVASRQLLFAATQYDQELWSTDGSTAGTGLLADIGQSSFPGLPPTASGRPRELTRLQDLVLFTAYGDQFSFEDRLLFRTDGTTEGTETVQEQHTADFLVNVSDLTPLGDHVLMAAQHPETGRELAVTDGTAAGTRILLDLLPGAESSDPYLLRRLGGRVLFFTRQQDGPHPGSSLWSTDGQQNVDLVSRIEIDGLPSHVLDATVAGDRLYFVAANEATGAELWVSDGSLEGTRLLRNLRQGPRGSHPQHLTVVDDNLLVFSADDGRHGRELWGTDGRRMWRVTDLAPGVGSSTPELPTVTTSHIYFSADDGVHGRELWTIDRAGLAAATGERQQRVP